MPIQIEVKNISTVMTDAQVAAALSAVEAQVADDLAPIWGNEPATLTLVKSDADFSPGVWQFIVVDTPEQVSQDGPGAAGDDAGEGSVPVGYAFARITRQAGMDPNVTISHEVLEMIGDASIDHCQQWSDIPNALFLAQELCDPVADDSLAYWKNGVMVSDFVTPSYFVPGSAGPWDFGNRLSGPDTLAVGGCQLTWDPANGWQQQVPGEQPRDRAAMATRYSRRVRRLRKAWTRSVLALPVRTVPFSYWRVAFVTATRPSEAANPPMATPALEYTLRPLRRCTPRALQP
jgi:hypothetical protein